MTQSGFVLRVAPSGVDKVSEALSANHLIIGWAEAEGLLDVAHTWEEFRTIVRDAYYAGEPTLRRAGNAAGQLWRFIREMKPGDLVVVPHGREFYVGEVAGPATYDKGRMQDDTAYRRGVRWLNDAKPIPRDLARSALLSRTKIQGTCADATDLLDEIKQCVALGCAVERPNFQNDLQTRLVGEVLRELRSGRIESFGFERLIQTVLRGLGAEEVRIVPRSEDKGAALFVSDLR